MDSWQNYQNNNYFKELKDKIQSIKKLPIWGIILCTLSGILSIVGYVFMWTEEEQFLSNTLSNPSLEGYGNAINEAVNYVEFAPLIIGLGWLIMIPGFVISICAAVKNSGILKINSRLNTPNGLLIASAILSFFPPLNIIAAILLSIAKSKLNKLEYEIDLEEQRYLKNMNENNGNNQFQNPSYQPYPYPPFPPYGPNNNPNNQWNQGYPNNYGQNNSNYPNYKETNQNPYGKDNNPQNPNPYDDKKKNKF